MKNEFFGAKNKKRATTTKGGGQQQAAGKSNDDDDIYENMKIYIYRSKKNIQSFGAKYK